MQGMRTLEVRAVPPHAMKALWGRESIAPTHSWPQQEMGVSDQRQSSAAFTSGERNRGTHWTGGWVGPRAGLDTETRGKILCLCEGSNLDHPVVKSVVRHYTDWATPAPCVYNSRIKILASTGRPIHRIGTHPMNTTLQASAIKWLCFT
jgi:hypothetical protein